MSDAQSDASYESDQEIQDQNQETESVESEEDANAIANVRSSVQNWKLREMAKNKETNSNVQGFDPLRKYVSHAAQLYYDLIAYLNTSKNKDTNMMDKYYVNIISAIGIPGALSYPLRMLLQHILQRDLVELPYTMEPKIINAHAKNGSRATTEFPDEE